MCQITIYDMHMPNVHNKQCQSFLWSLVHLQSLNNTKKGLRHKKIAVAWVTVWVTMAPQTLSVYLWLCMCVLLLVPTLAALVSLRATRSPATARRVKSRCTCFTTLIWPYKWFFSKRTIHRYFEIYAIYFFLSNKLI